jgi:acetoacetyl-CoA synthetase
MSEILWTPSDEWVERAHLTGFMQRAPGAPGDYHDLWEWSVDDLAGFWGQVWAECGVIASQGYERVLGEARMPGTEWFTGSRLSGSTRRRCHVSAPW